MDAIENRAMKSSNSAPRGVTLTVPLILLAIVPTVAIWWEYSWVAALAYGALYIAIVYVALSAEAWIDWRLKGVEARAAGYADRHSQRLSEAIDRLSERRE